jgi:hypothetical protein
VDRPDPPHVVRRGHDLGSTRAKVSTFLIQTPVNLPVLGGGATSVGASCWACAFISIEVWMMGGSRNRSGFRLSVVLALFVVAHPTLVRPFRVCRGRANQP